MERQSSPTVSNVAGNVDGCGVTPTDRIIINGFINAADGTKMSKTLGNVIAPTDIIDSFKDVTPYPEEVLRYYLARHINSFDDSGMRWSTVKEAYRAHLQNGLGNLTSRLMNMVVNYEVVYNPQAVLQSTLRYRGGRTVSWIFGGIRKFRYSESHGYYMVTH